MLSAWWFVQGAAYIAKFAAGLINDGKPLIWAVTFGIILCLGAYLRHKGEQLKRIADMILLAYSMSFAVVAYLLVSAMRPELWVAAAFTVVAVSNVVFGGMAVFYKPKHDRK